MLNEYFEAKRIQQEATDAKVSTIERKNLLRHEISTVIFEVSNICENLFLLEDEEIANEFRQLRMKQSYKRNKRIQIEIPENSSNDADTNMEIEKEAI